MKRLSALLLFLTVLLSAMALIACEEGEVALTAVPTLTATPKATHTPTVSPTGATTTTPEATVTREAPPWTPPARRCSEPEFEPFEAPSFPSQNPRTGKYIEANTYCGTVTIDGQPAPDGTLVEAVVEGEVCASVEAQEGLYKLHVPLFLCPEDVGHEVTFLVGGREARERGRLASPIYSWSLDLTVGD